MLQEKLGFIAFSFCSTYVLAEFTWDFIFPMHIFSFPAFVYGFISNLIYTMLEIYRRQKKFVENVEGIKPFSKQELILKMFRPFMAAIFNVIIFAVLSAYAISNPSGVMVENINFLKTKEGTILMGILLGFGFEYITSDESAGMVKRQVKEWVKSVLEKLS